MELETNSCLVFLYKHIFVNVTLGHFVVQILTVLSFVQFKLKLNFYIYIFALFALCALVMYTHMQSNITAVFTQRTCMVG
jgi:hypothetical protein